MTAELELLSWQRQEARRRILGIRAELESLRSDAEAAGTDISELERQIEDLERTGI
jgi:polyhydroxyalkanoate synthesis regulator phasin